MSDNFETGPKIDPVKKGLITKAQEFAHKYLDEGLSGAEDQTALFRDSLAAALRDVRSGKPEKIVGVLQSMASNIKYIAGSYIPEEDDQYGGKPLPMETQLWGMEIQQLAWDIQVEYGIPVDLSEGDRRMLKGLSRFRKAQNDGEV